jgi:hypothetical protein
MHNISVMFAGENVAGAAHIRCQLVNFVEFPVDHRLTQFLVAQIPDDKIIGDRCRKLWKFQIHPADPKVFTFQPSYEMATNKAASSAHERRSHSLFPFSVAISELSAFSR